MTADAVAAVIRQRNMDMCFASGYRTCQGNDLEVFFSFQIFDSVRQTDLHPVDASYTAQNDGGIDVQLFALFFNTLTEIVTSSQSESQFSHGYILSSLDNDDKQITQQKERRSNDLLLLFLCTDQFQ